ncbi:outer membrane protein assembly factor BamE, partial [Pseudomonas marginalis]
MIFDYLMTGSIGPIRVGMPREEVRACLGGELRTFKKTSLSSNTLDAFEHHSVHVYYDDGDLVKGVEFFSVENFSWRGKKIVGESYAELKKCLAQHGVVFSS